MNNEQIDLDLVKQIREAMEENKLDFERTASFKLAVLRAEFTLKILQDDMRRIVSQPVSDLELEKLQENAEYNEKRNTWCLHDGVRSQGLSLLPFKEISQLLEKMDFTGADWRQ